jgi:hypothetical protein
MCLHGVAREKNDVDLKCEKRDWEGEFGKEYKRRDVFKRLDINGIGRERELGTDWRTTHESRGISIWLSNSRRQQHIETRDSAIREIFGRGPFHEDEKGGL